MVPYEVSFYTGDTSNAGTDSEVFIKVFGQRGATSEIQIEKDDDRFERGKVDLIKVVSQLLSNFFIVEIRFM